MSELLIPFGIHRETGHVVEPEDAAKGRSCNCLCPGCKAPLLSRHPKERRAHFAHDSRHKDARPEEECPFSSAVAVAMMIREVAPQVIGRILETPSLDTVKAYPCCGSYASLRVTEKASNVIANAHVSAKAFGHHVDVLLDVGGYPILVDLVYKGKPAIFIDDEKLQDNKAALLKLDCDSFSSFTFSRDRDLRFSEAVLKFFLKDGKRDWGFHPKTNFVLKKASRDHQCIKLTPKTSYFQRNYRHNLHANHGSKVVEERAVRYRCIMCRAEWIKEAGDIPTCPKCQSHLYAVPAKK